MKKGTIPALACMGVILLSISLLIWFLLNSSVKAGSGATSDLIFFRNISTGMVGGIGLILLLSAIYMRFFQNK